MDIIGLLFRYGWIVIVLLAIAFHKQMLMLFFGTVIIAKDEVGIVNKISKVISSELKVNVRSISIDSNDGIFDGTIMLFVHDTEHLTKLMKKLKEIHGILTVSRVDAG